MNEPVEGLRTGGRPWCGSAALGCPLVAIGPFTVGVVGSLMRSERLPRPAWTALPLNLLPLLAGLSLTRL